MTTSARSKAPTLGETLFSREFERRYGEDLRHDQRLGERAGAWVEWTEDAGWVRRKRPPGLKMAHVVRDLCRNAKEVTRFDRSSTRTGALSLVAERVAQTEWDNDPYLLGTPGCTVLDLRTGEVRGQQREDCITRSTRTMPAEDCRSWEEVVSELSCDDPSMVQYLATVGVDCATGEQGDHRVEIAHGKPGTGKDTFFTSLGRALGDYATTTASENLMVRRFSAPPTWMADLYNARMVISSEVPKGVEWNCSLVSEMTGGGLLKARFMRQDEFSFHPKFRLILLCNDLPILPSSSSGMVRRVHVIPFERVMGAAIDRSVARHFQAEGAGEVLRWVCKNAAEVYGRDVNAKYPRCERIVAATKEYTRTANPFDTYASLTLERVEGSEERFHTEAAYDLYVKWSKAAQGPSLTAAGFSRALAAYMAPNKSVPVEIDGVRRKGYVGCRIRPSAGMPF